MGPIHTCTFICFPDPTGTEHTSSELETFSTCASILPVMVPLSTTFTSWMSVPQFVPIMVRSPANSNSSLLGAARVDDKY